MYFDAVVAGHIDNIVIFKKLTTYFTDPLHMSTWTWLLKCNEVIRTFIINKFYCIRPV